MSGGDAPNEDEDEIEARVAESVNDATAREPAEPAPPEPTTIELSEIEPLPGELWEPPSPPFGARRAMKWLAFLLLFAVAAGAILIFTDSGRDLLPASMKPEARKVAREIERRAKKVGTEELYTFTDDQGVVHIVDDLEKIPRKYRARAKKKN